MESKNNNTLSKQQYKHKVHTHKPPTQSGLILENTVQVFTNPGIRIAPNVCSGSRTVVSYYTAGCC